MGATIAGNQVLINGQPITGASTNTPIQSGEIAGLIDLRDNVAPQYQSQLDQIAGNLITAFQETDQSASATGLPAEPGLFTATGLTGVPSASDFTGLASAIVRKPLGRPGARRRSDAAARRRHFRHPATPTTPTIRAATPATRDACNN